MLFVLLLAQHADAAESRDYMLASWNYTTKEVISSLAAGDLDGDGLSEAVVASSSEGIVRAFDGDGALMWDYIISGYVFAVLADDFDGDGRDEVVVGAGTHVFMLNESGELLWKYYAGVNNARVVASVDFAGGRDKKVLAGAYSQECNRNTIFLLNSSGGREWLYQTGYPVPFIFHGVDLDGDRNEEVLVGFVERSRDTVRKTCVPAYVKETEILALDEFGNVLWTKNTSGAVNAISSADLDGDGHPEIFAGTYPMLYMLDGDGSLLWNTSTVSRVEAVTTEDLDGDGKKEIIFNSDNVYAFNQNGNVMWMGETSDRAYTLAVADLNNDESPEIVAGSDALYVFSADGSRNFKSDRLVSVSELAVGDFNGDGLPDVVVGAVRQVILFETGYAAKTQSAEAFYMMSQDYARAGEKDSALEYAEKARQAFLEVGDLKSVAEVLKLVDSIKGVAYLNQSNETTTMRQSTTSTVPPAPVKLSDFPGKIRAELTLENLKELLSGRKNIMVYLLIGAAVIVFLLCLAYLTGMFLRFLHHYFKTPKLDDRLKEKYKSGLPRGIVRGVKRGAGRGVSPRKGS